MNLQNTTRINAHGHVIPYPEEIPAFMKDNKYFWIEPDGSAMRQGDWSRPVTHASFFADTKIQWMDKNSIDHMVVIVLSQLYGNGMPKQALKDMHSWYNDYQGLLQAHHRERMTCGMVVNPAYMDQALKEVERCVTKLKLKVLCLPTHYYSADGEWICTSDETTEPLWQLANEYGLAIEIHPYDGQKMINLSDKHWRFHSVWMCAQTADNYHEFMLNDFGCKYPNVRTCYAHGNQYSIVNHGRRRQAYVGRPDFFEGKSHPDQCLGMDNVFFDTLVHDELSLEMLMRRFGASQLVAGLDDPYPLGEMDDIEDGYPGKLIDSAVENGFMTNDQRSDIWKDNVLRWLG